MTNNLLNKLLIVSFTFFTICTVQAQSLDSNYQEGIIYVKIDKNSNVNLSPYDSSLTELNSILETYVVDSISRPFPSLSDELNNVYRLFFAEEQSVNAFISALENLSFVKYAEKSPIYRLDYIPNDYNASKSWHLDKIQAPAAWQLSKGSSDITIAIIDNGVYLTHEDLQGNIWVNPGETENGWDSDQNGYVDDMHGWDVADNNNNPQPPELGNTAYDSPFNHGTHCAGIASAVTDNGIGIASIGHNSRIIAVKCSPDNSDGNELINAHDGLYYSIRASADVASMSFGSPAKSLTFELIVSTAEANGVLMFAAAGNDNSTSPSYPAAFSEVISVGATDVDDKKAWFSNYGEYIDIMAPGEAIYSTLASEDKAYSYLSGTSMATPLAAGMAALMIAHFPEKSATEIKNRIIATCDPIDAINEEYEGQLGAGRINAAKALGTQTAISEKLKKFNNYLKVFPNPSDNRNMPGIYFNAPESGTLFLNIYNPEGKLIFSDEKPVNEGELYIPDYNQDEQTVRQGIYILHLRLNAESYSKKFIIE